MKEHVQAFLEDLQVRNYSARTIADYGYHLNLWTQFLEPEQVCELNRITDGTVAEFQRWLYYHPTRRGAARGVQNQNTVLAAIKSFFRFLKNEGLLVHDPAAAVEYARQPKTLPRSVLTPEEAKQILERVDTSTPVGKRDRAILEVLYATGIRRSELRNLTLNDLDLAEGLVRITLGKGAKDRVVPLGTMAVQALYAYLNDSRPQLLGRGLTDRLFLSYRGHPLDPHTLGALVKRRAQAADIKKLVTPHVWRHTCATHLVQNHASLRHVQDLLGHRSLATTERYLRLTITDLKEAHAKFHPRENAGMLGKDLAQGGKPPAS
jgi:integrase/recombinase XerD